MMNVKPTLLFVVLGLLEGASVDVAVRVDLGLRRQSDSLSVHTLDDSHAQGVHEHAFVDTLTGPAGSLSNNQIGKIMPIHIIEPNIIFE